MILFDPDLTSSPAKGESSAVRLSTRGAPAAERSHRLPSVRTLARFLAEARGAVRLRGQVSVLLTTDARLRRLNRQFRGINKPTDVLSFPAGEAPDGAARVAGDLAISVPAARRQAVEHGHALAAEIKILILHGLLHLAGYDHETDGGRMARRERRLRAGLGLPTGLIERTEGAAPKKHIARRARPATGERR